MCIIKKLKWIILGTFLINYLLFSGVCYAINTESTSYSSQLEKNNFDDSELNKMKFLLKPTHSKLNSELLGLINNEYLPEGVTKDQIKEQMKSLKQITPTNQAYSKSLNNTSGDQVYVYIQINSNNFSDLAPYVNDITNYDEKNQLVVAWVPVDKLDALAELESVKTIQTVVPPQVKAGNVTSEGDHILQADLYRNLVGTDGTGIKIGILSDGVNNRQSAIASGDLPSNLHVLSDSVGGDEGTAMLEIVHDLAPGAELYFHDCGNNTVEFNSAIDELVAAGCKIVCDDIGWLQQPYFEDGIVAQHVSSVIANSNIIYVSSAGNDASSHYQGTYYLQSGTSNFHDFSSGSSQYKNLYINIPAGDSVLAFLQWNDKFGAAGDDYDLFLVNDNTGDLITYSNIKQNGSQNPLEAVYWENNTGSTVIADLLVKKYSGNSKELEVFIYNSAAYTNNIKASDSIYGHPAVPNVITVGSVNANTPTSIAFYSSQGPITISYPNRQTRNKPDLCAVDGVTVTGAGGFPSTFYGTSAAAPHVAAIAALVWSKNPTSTASEIRSNIVNGAYDLGSAGFDNIYGNGRVDALGAIPPHKDLIEQMIDGPETGASGGTISVSDTAVNQGNTATAAAFYVKYYLSSDTTISSSDTYLGQRQVASGLAAGGNSTAATSLTIPSTMAGGSYYIGGIADATNTIIESDETNNANYDATPIMVTAPDLTVQSVSGPAAGTTGSTIRLTSTIKNNSTANVAKVFYVNFYLSSDSTINSADKLIGKQSVSSLAAGAAKDLTLNYTIPSTLANGNYYMGVIADGTNLVGESDETNNSNYAAAQIAITAPYKDLTEQTINGPETGASGGTISVSDTAVNQGNTATTAAFYVKYYLSSDTTIASTDTYLGQRQVASGLAAGGSSAAATSLTIPTTMAGGSYYIGGITDATNAITESDETNNSNYDATPIVVTAPYKDLIEQTIDGPETGASGGTISVSDTAVNQGNTATAAAFYVKYYLSSDTTISSSDTYLGQRQVASGLAAGGNSTAATSLTIPSTMAGGSYYIGGIADATNTIIESDETNNANYDATPIMVTAPDLIVQSVSGPAAGTTGSTIRLTSTIKNNSTANVAKVFYVNFYLSSDSTITSADKNIGRQSVSSLAAGAAKDLILNYAIPSTLAKGNYYIGVIADGTNVVGESDETNNSSYAASQIAIIAPYKDLIEQTIDGPETGASGGTISVNDTAVNQGNTATTATFYVKYYLSSDTTISSSDTYLGQRQVASGLAAGGSSAAATSLTIPSTMVGGRYYIGGITDATNAITESDETNNSNYDATPIVVTAPYKDLIEQTIDGPETGASGGTISVSDTAVNQGNTATAAAFYVKYYLSSDTTISSTDTYLGQRMVASGLAAGGSSTVATRLTIPSTMAGGSYYIGGIADATNTIIESDETNNANCDASPIVVTAPDLIVQSVSGPAAGTIGSTISLTSTIKNNSAANVAKVFYVYYYLSSDSTITSADKNIGKQSVSSLAAGAAKDLTLNYAIPSTLANGNYYIGVIADGTNVVRESDETNNSNCADAQIAINAS